MQAINLFKQRWIITLIGVIALSILVWFVGPYIAIADKKILESAVVRLVCIMVLLLIWGLNNLRATVQAKNKNESLAQDLQKNDKENPENSGEASILDSRFKDAVETLRRSSGNKNRYSKNYLYDLPWYILIGPPGSGKTTALVNSGLSFPLEEQFGRGAVKGVGGTRHCDWWFTDQAVMIDTAGRYTTQDSHASADAKAWVGFIHLLKKYRKRRPVNGVMIAMSIDDLRQQTEAELSANVNAIRARLQELTDHLGVNFPVYILLTKCDLIPGFSQYFDMMGKEERSQVWGMTFPEALESHQTYQQYFNDEYALLAKRLHDNLFSKFHFERDFQRRAAILSFPAHFEQLKNVFSDFIGRTFSESRFHHSFLLRGVYLTSGTQEAAGMQRMMQNVAGQMGFGQESLLSSSTHGKSYFLRNLFQNIVFPEAELVSTNHKYERRMRWLRNGGYVATFISAIGMTVAWSTSYGLNESRLSKAQTQLVEYSAQQSALTGEQTPEQTLMSMQSLLALRDTYQPESDGWEMGFGLYQGDVVSDSAQEQYQIALHQDFHQALQNLLAGQLKSNRDLPEYLHHALKAYLMLSLPERLDKDYLKAWLQADWQNRYADQPDQLIALKQHLEQLLIDDWAVLKADEILVNDTRRILKRVPLARQIYASIQEKARQKMPMEYRFDSQIGHDIHYVFNGDFVSIPWLFTAEGYHDFFKPQQSSIIEDLADDSWVVGARSEDMSELDLANIQAEIEKNYLDDYIGYWRSAIAQLQLQRSETLDDHIRLLNEMLSGSSPLRRVLDEVVAHTQLSKPLIDPSVVTENIKGASAAARMVDPKAGKLSRIASLAGRNRLINLPENPATLVDKRFEPLHDLMLANGNQAAPFERVYSGLTELQLYLEGITSSGSSGQAAFDAALSRFRNGRNDPIGKLKIEARHLPEPIKQWVDALVDSAWAHMLAAARSHVADEYDIMVRPFYERGIEGRYPLNKQAKVEITLADFSEFFKAGGIEHQFFEGYLAPFVDTRKSPWRIKAVDGQGLSISKRNLAAFEQAYTIRSIFFAEGDAPSVNFKLRATYLDANINRFELDLLGERLEYRHGPARNSAVNWPSDSGQETIKYTFEDHYGVQFSDQIQGAWALFRFLDEFPLAKTGYSDRFKLTVKDQERKAIYEIYANSAVNPFGKDYLGHYRLPKQL